MDFERYKAVIFVGISVLAPHTMLMIRLLVCYLILRYLMMQISQKLVKGELQKLTLIFCLITSGARFYLAVRKLVSLWQEPSTQGHLFFSWTMSFQQLMPKPQNILYNTASMGT